MNISSTNNEEQEWRPSTNDYEIILWCTVFILTVIAILCANTFYYEEVTAQAQQYTSHESGQR